MVFCPKSDNFAVRIAMFIMALFDSVFNSVFDGRLRKGARVAEEARLESV